MNSNYTNHSFELGSVYPICQSVSDYICYAIGETGSEYSPNNNNNVNQIMLSQWKHMISVRKLYSLVRKVKEGLLDKMVAQQAIHNHNKNLGTSMSFNDVENLQLEKPDNVTFSPMGDPWIFFRCKQGINIYDLLNEEIPTYHGADISEAERLFIHLNPYMDLLYIADWNRDILIVIKSQYKRVAPYSWDDRYPERLHDLYQSIPKGYYTFGDDGRVDIYTEDFMGEVYTLPPEMEQSIHQEAEMPHLHQ